MEGTLYTRYLAERVCLLIDVHQMVNKQNRREIGTPSSLLGASSYFFGTLKRFCLTPIRFKKWAWIQKKI